MTESKTPWEERFKALIIRMTINNEFDFEEIEEFFRAELARQKADILGRLKMEKILPNHDLKTDGYNSAVEEINKKIEEERQ